MNNLDLLFRVANVLIPVFSLIVVGYVYARRFSANIRVGNQMNMRIFVPALVFSSLTQKTFNLASHPWLIVATVLLVLLCGIGAWMMTRFTHQNTTSFVPSMMFNNSGNMGLPIALLAFGEQGLQIALILFIVTNLMHFTLGVRIVSGRMFFKEVFLNAVNIATILGLLVSLNRLQLPQMVSVPIDMAGQVAIPLMLVSLGVRMADFSFKHISEGLFGALARPFLGAVAAAIVITILPISEFEQKLLILYAVMPPAVLNYLFAEQYQQSPKTVASIVIVGNAISIFVLYFTLVFIL